MNRPAETASLGLGTVTGAVFTLLGAFGVTVPVAVPGATLILVGAVAGAVSWYVDRNKPAA